MDEMTLRLVGYMPSGKVGGVLTVEERAFPNEFNVKNLQHVLAILWKPFFGEVIPRLEDGSYRTEFGCSTVKCACSFIFILEMGDKQIKVDMRGIANFVLSHPNYGSFVLRYLHPALCEIASIYTLTDDPQFHARWADKQIAQIRENYKILDTVETR
jgi:hypothetical protein